MSNSVLQIVVVVATLTGVPPKDFVLEIIQTIPPPVRSVEELLDTGRNIKNGYVLVGMMRVVVEIRAFFPEPR